MISEENKINLINGIYIDINDQFSIIAKFGDSCNKGCYPTILEGYLEQESDIDLYYQIFIDKKVISGCLGAFSRLLITDKEIKINNIIDHKNFEKLNNQIKDKIYKYCNWLISKDCEEFLIRYNKMQIFK